MSINTRISDSIGASRSPLAPKVRSTKNSFSESPTVDIAITMNPESELRLVWLSIPDQEPASRDFDDSRFRIGIAHFAIACEVGEITTDVLLAIQYHIESSRQRVCWHLVATPRPALKPLAAAMEKCVAAEGEEDVERQALRGRGFYSSLKGDGR